MTDLGGTIPRMASIPLLRAMFASGDFSVEEWERACTDALMLCKVAEDAHDFMSLVRPADMDHHDWEDLKALHARRLRASLMYFSFG